MILRRRVKPIAAISVCAILVGCASAQDNEPKRFPTSEDFPASVMTRTSLIAGGGHGWRLSALHTPERSDAPWKIVVVTGTPSWPEYWAPTIAKLGLDREMIVADRPGFALSEPRQAVTSIEWQAEALSALLDGPANQKVVLIGQSYGGPIATLLAAMRPDKVKGLVLMSAFFGDRGPTVRRLDGMGSLARPVLPRDLKNSLLEIRNQKPQIPNALQALSKLDVPIVVLHGDKDTFVRLAAAEKLAKTNTRMSMAVVPAGDHFLNACCVDAVIDATERVIAKAEGR
jgi:pimeloyl-ACP methyl ester carboxylesterase